jgi:hypothetical protein
VLESYSPGQLRTVTDRLSTEIHERELAELSTADLTQNERVELRAGWLAKIDRPNRGEQRWGEFRSRRHD